MIEVVKGPSKGKVYRSAPNQQQLSVGRTTASLIHVKSPGVSEKHAEVSADHPKSHIPLDRNACLFSLTHLLFCFFLEGRLECR